MIATSRVRRRRSHGRRRMFRKPSITIWPASVPVSVEFWPLASTLFAVALLASGQNSTLTGTLAGQIVMEGFLNIRLRPWLRRLITRLIAIIPAVIVTAISGESGTAKLLVLSQVILSLQLSFAVIPLILFTSDRLKMGEFANPLWMKITAWVIAIIIVVLNAKLLADFFGITNWLAAAASRS